MENMSRIMSERGAAASFAQRRNGASAGAAGFQSIIPASREAAWIED